MPSRRSSPSAATARPRVHVAPRGSSTFGDLAGDLAASYGLAPDDWQRLILEDWLRVSGGRWSSLTCGLAVPRQNGKNAVLEIRELFGMVGRGEKFLHTAHEVKTARKHFKRLQHFFGTQVADPGARFPELNRLVAEIRNVNGQEAVMLKNGGSVEIVARSKGSGRGFTVDVLVMDEAQELDDDALEALMPTTSASPLGNPQWIYTGTPPGPNVSGEVFTRVRDDALSGKSKRLAWHEWSAEGGIDLDDRAVWHATNPALGTRLQLDVVEGERARFSDEGFGRERLGMWSAAGSQRVIDAVSWALCADPSSEATSGIAFGIDVNPTRTVASIAVGGRRSDERRHVEVIDNRQGDPAWIVPRAVALNAAWRPRTFVVDAIGPAASLVPDLVRAGVPVVVTKTADMTTACAQLYDGVVSGQVRHYDQPVLNDALGVARKRAVGAEGAWAWHRLNADSDITPLVAVTLADFGATGLEVDKRITKRKRRGTGKVVVS